VSREHWATPEWIDKTRYMDSLDYLGTVGVGKGHLLSYVSIYSSLFMPAASSDVIICIR